MKAKFLLTILFSGSVAAFFFACQKRLTGHVEVSGRVIDFYTREPLVEKVYLHANDVRPRDEDSIVNLASAMSNLDGTFRLRSRPSKTGHYYITVNGGKSLQKVELSANKVTELGELEAGAHDFVCKVIFMPRSDSSITFRKTPSSNEFYSYTPGTTGTIELVMTMTAPLFNAYKKSFPVQYYTKCGTGCYGETSNFKNIPIGPPGTAITGTIYY